MIWIYRILFLPGLIISLPKYWLQTRRRGNFKEGLEQRFGWAPRQEQKLQGNLRVWIQAVSVGELQAINPLLESLNEKNTLKLF